MPRVLITGAAGFIGMHTSIRFLREGWDVIGLDNINDYYSTKLKKDRLSNITQIANERDSVFKFYCADLNSNIWQEFDDLEITVLIHLAAQAGVRHSLINPRAYIEANILGFQSVLEFVEKHSIEKFIYASSSSVYGQSSKQPFNENEGCGHPESYYAATKRANELMAHSYYRTKQINSIGLRFFTVYGPWGRPDMAPHIFIQAAFQKAAINVFNHGNQMRDFTYIDDIVEGITKLVKENTNTTGALVLNIGKGKPDSLMDFIKIIEFYTERKLNKKFIEAQVGDVKHTCADTNMLKRLIGYTPEINLDYGIMKYVDWFKNYYQED